MHKEPIPEDLKNKIEQMTNLQRTYCEFRARGFSQAQSALRAGSSADKANLPVVGHQLESTHGAKDYIVWLKAERAKTSVIDRVRVIEMLNDIYKESMSSGEYKEANTSAKLLGMALGLFDHKNTGVVKKEEVTSHTTKNNTEAFKDGEEELEPNQSDSKYKELQEMLKELNKISK